MPTLSPQPDDCRGSERRAKSAKNPPRSPRQPIKGAEIRSSQICQLNRRTMTDVSHGPEWWQASDLKWYPPELHADYVAPLPPPPELPPPPPTPVTPTQSPITTKGLSGRRKVWFVHSWAGPTSHCRPGGCGLGRGDWIDGHHVGMGTRAMGQARPPGLCRDRDRWRDDRGPVGSVWRTQSHVRCRYWCSPSSRCRWRRRS